VKRALDKADGSKLHAELSSNGKIALALDGETLDFGPDEIEVAVEAAAGFAADTGKIGVVVLHTTLTDELIEEGIQREILSRLQQLRKDLDLAFTDRIRVWIDGSERIRRILRDSSEHIKTECLAIELTIGDLSGAPEAAIREHAIGDEVVKLAVVRVSN
jgi:isoleucyl-tRNA synthetase